MGSQRALRIDRLRQLREEHGWSQRELARLCGFGDAQIRKYEIGMSDPSATYLKLMADHLGVSTDYLLGNTDNPHIHLGNNDLSSEEIIIVETFRRDGWSGVIRLSAEHVTK